MFIDWISLRRSTAVRRGGTHSLKPPASMSERGQSQRKNVLRALFLVLYFVPAIEQFSSNVHLTITKTKNKEQRTLSVLQTLLDLFRSLRSDTINEIKPAAGDKLLEILNGRDLKFLMKQGGCFWSNAGKLQQIE